MATETKEYRYTGSFDCNGKNVPGEIVYKQEKGIINITLRQRFDCQDDYLAIITTEREYEETNRVRTPRIPRITGVLHTGEPVILNNCRRYYDVFNGNIRTLKYRADNMIFDELQDTVQQYHRFTFVVENALLWSGMTQVVTQTDPKDYSKQVKFRNNNYHKRFSWGDVKVKFTTQLDYTDLIQFERIERSEVVEHLKIQIIAQNGNKTVEEFLKLRNQILAMISFAIKDNVNVVSQYFCTENDFYTYESATNPEEREYTKFYIFTNEKQHHLIRQVPDEYNFFLKNLPLKKDLGDTIGKLLPIFDLYSSFFHYSDMPLEMLFLNVTQALETFHARFFYDNNKRTMAESIKKRFGVLTDPNPLRVQLLGGSENGHIVLGSRLNDLFARGAHDLFAEFYLEDHEYAYRIVQTRNYYTHYPQDLESDILEGNELFDVIQVLKWVLEYHVCTALGVRSVEEKIRYKLYPELERKKKQEIYAVYMKQQEEEAEKASENSTEGTASE